MHAHSHTQNNMNRNALGQRSELHLAVTHDLFAQKNILKLHHMTVAAILDPERCVFVSFSKV